MRSSPGSSATVLIAPLRQKRRVRNHDGFVHRDEFSVLPILWLDRVRGRFNPDICKKQKCLEYANRVLVGRDNYFRTCRNLPVSNQKYWLKPFSLLRSKLLLRELEDVLTLYLACPLNAG